jgi:multidrug efflux pump
LPQVDYPTISVQASLPGASPETMAATVATPLERSLGRISGVTEMTSSSSLGSTRITLQFDLSRDIDGAARDVQAAINAARNLLPSGLPSNPTYRKVNPADAPIMILALTSATMTQGQMYDAASTIIAQKLSQVTGVGQVSVGGSSLPAVRVELSPASLNQYGVGLEDVRAALAAANANRPKGAVEDGDRHWQIYANDQAKTAAEYLPLIVSPTAPRSGATDRCRRGGRFGAGPAQRRHGQRQAVGAGRHQPPAQCEHHRNGRSRDRAVAVTASIDSEHDRSDARHGTHDDDSRVAA